MVLLQPLITWAAPDDMQWIGHSVACLDDTVELLLHGEVPNPALGTAIKLRGNLVLHIMFFSLRSTRSNHNIADPTCGSKEQETLLSPRQHSEPGSSHY